MFSFHNYIAIEKSEVSSCSVSSDSDTSFSDPSACSSAAFFCREPFLLKFSLRRVAPRYVTVKVFQQMMTCGFEFLTDHSQPQQPCAEGVLFIFGLCLSICSAFLHQRLMAYCKTKLNVGFHLARVQRRVEQSKLNCSVREHTVKI